MSQNETGTSDHPRPWIKVMTRSGITLRDAEGATVLVLPFTGVASRDRKARAADLILRAVNGEVDKGEPLPARSVNRGRPGQVSVSFRVGGGSGGGR
jgi:hypothetical protein